MSRSEPTNRVTIGDVARHAGVSPMTVSRVINEAHTVKPATREKVLESMDALAYVPNGAARSLVVRRLGVVALVVPDLGNPFFGALARSVEAAARRNGLTVLLANTDTNVDAERDTLRTVASLGVDGILLTPCGHQSADNIRWLERIGKPLVMIDRQVRGVEHDLVVGDSLPAAVALTEHLIGHGHTRIACLAPPRDPMTSQLRIRGWKQALRAHGLDAPDEYLRVTEYSRSAAAKATTDLLALDEPPTAIVAANHFLAFGAVDAADSLGVGVPEDLALVTFDDVEVTLREPILTCADQPVEEMGRIAFQLLVDRMDDPTRAPQRVRVPSELRIRSSCGC